MFSINYNANANKKQNLFNFSFEDIDGNLVNLEKSLKYGERISGHFVQGHVDTSCHVSKIHHVGKSWLINFTLLKRLLFLN